MIPVQTDTQLPGPDFIELFLRAADRFPDYPALTCFGRTRVINRFMNRLNRPLTR
jgi:hypothetical protein